MSTPSTSLSSLRAAALDAVVAASKVCQEVQARLVAGAALQKGDKSPVTVADFAAQAIVAILLEKSAPGIPLVGEEDASALRDAANVGLKDKVVAAVQAVLPDVSENDVLIAIDSGVHPGGPRGRFWVLDPIDGTKGFLRLEQYAVALALIEDGEVVLGVLGCPNLPIADGATTTGCLFAAIKGGAATQRGIDDPTETPISVDTVAEASRARFCESVEKGHTNQSDSARVAHRLGITAEPYRMDSQCKYAVVARGDAAVYLRLPTIAGYVERVWDHAAGVAVIEAAGGMVTDCLGQRLDFSRGRGLEGNTGVIVTNGRFHAEVVAAVRAELGL